MTQYKKQTVSDHTLKEANAIAKGTQKPGQTKEQSKLIAQGIAKGIDLYKKQQKAKAREQNKLLKKQQKQSQPDTADDAELESKSHSYAAILPWLLLVVSWAAFGVYYSFS